MAYVVAMPKDDAAKEVQNLCGQLGDASLDAQTVDDVLALLFDLVMNCQDERDESTEYIARALEQAHVVQRLVVVAQQCCFLAACAVLCALSDKLHMRISQHDAVHLVHNEPDAHYTSEQSEAVLRVLLRVTDWDASDEHYARVMHFCDAQRGWLVEALACAVMTCVHNVAPFVRNAYFARRAQMALSVLKLHDELLAFVQLRACLVEHMRVREYE